MLSPHDACAAAADAPGAAQPHAEAQRADALLRHARQPPRAGAGLLQPRAAEPGLKRHRAEPDAEPPASGIRQSTARHACAHAEDQRGYAGERLTAAESLETLRCFRAAFRDQPPWAAEPAHVCDTRCPLFRHRNVYVCCFSGQYHFCSELACDRLATLGASKVCRTTALCYALDFQATFEQGAGSADYKRNTRGVSTARRQRADDMALGGAPRAAAAVSDATRAKIDKPALIEYLEVLPFVRELLGRNTLPEERLSQLAGIVSASFSRLKAVSAFAARAATYTVRMHTLVVVYAMAQGGAFCGAQSFVEPQADVRQHLPPLTAQEARVVPQNMCAQFRVATQTFNGLVHMWFREHRPADALADHTHTVQL